MRPFVITIFLLAPLHAGENLLPMAGLMLDLNAAKGLEAEAGNRVIKWTSEVGEKRFEFVKQDGGRSQPGSGRPTLLEKVPALGGMHALEFLQQELVCPDEDAFDSLTTGSGHTWAAVIAVRPQRIGVKDVNSFFGNLKNGGFYEGFWACMTDDNRPWYGARNGLSFGRFDENNPQLLAPPMEPGTFHILIGRMQAGTGKVKLDFFIDADQPTATGMIPVNPAANPSRLAIGQERDAVEHPGKESFDGEIARFLIWQRPLEDAEIGKTINALRQAYNLTK